MLHFTTPLRMLLSGLSHRLSEFNATFRIDQMHRTTLQESCRLLAMLLPSPQSSGRLMARKFGHSCASATCLCNWVTTQVNLGNGSGTSAVKTVVVGTSSRVGVASEALNIRGGRAASSHLSSSRKTCCESHSTRAVQRWHLLIGFAVKLRVLNL